MAQPKWKHDLAVRVRKAGGKYVSGRIYSPRGNLTCYVSEWSTVHAVAKSVAERGGELSPHAEFVLAVGPAR